MPMNISTKFHACIRMCMIIVISRSTNLSTNEKRRYVMTSGLWQYIAGYTVANLCGYPIRRCVAFASALEYTFNSEAS